MPTAGLFNGASPAERRNGALNEKTPPSEATSQYPCWVAAGGGEAPGS